MEQIIKYFFYQIILCSLILIDRQHSILYSFMVYCSWKDSVFGEMPLPLPIIYYIITIGVNIIDKNYINLIIGFILLVIFFIMHQKDGPDGEPVIGGADVFALPAYLTSISLLTGLYGSIIGIMLSLMEGIVTGEKRVRLLSFIPSGILLIFLLEPVLKVI